MKKILMALTMIGMAYLSADGQTKSCGRSQDKVCRRSSGNTVSCYKTKYAENFPVCKGRNGYYICCETPTSTNTTHPVATNQQSQYENYREQYQTYEEATDVVSTAPQSQSYTNTEYGVNNSRSYEGYDPRKGKMKVCYTGDNVAQATRAPYEGCASDQYDGPEKNRQRNVNVVAPE